ncbi:MAG TPA: thioesterase family protein [Anaerolineales bacterium]|nr:thioesterase family protein [Anaerolineales bacterium]
MEIPHTIQVGQTHRQNFTVEPHHTAEHIGSGSVQVLATPMMIAYMETTALNLLQPHLPDGYSSVGTRVDVRHLAPSPLGSLITVSAEVEQIDGAKVTLKVAAREGETLVGSGIHIRYLIEVVQFMKKLKKD